MNSRLPAAKNTQYFTAMSKGLLHSKEFSRSSRPYISETSSTYPSEDCPGAPSSSKSNDSYDRCRLIRFVADIFAIEGLVCGSGFRDLVSDVGAGGLHGNLFSPMLIAKQPR